MRRTLAALLSGVAIAAVSAVAAPVFAADPPGKPAGEEAKKDPDTAVAPVAEQAQPSHHSIPFRGGTLSYTATPGTLTIRNNDGAPIASVFYVAYTLDRGGKDAGPRPITFLFNGGPGSSTMWLHMGSFGPMKVDASQPAGIAPAPFRFAPNPDTLLDKSDLVFIDAVTTGLSRPLGKAEPKDFFGVDQDLDAFTRAIQRYLTINQRWNSPKFIIGESYGTLRAAGLANTLESSGVQLNGVVLMSTVLDIDALFDKRDANYINATPTYAAIAAYHNRLQNKPADLQAYLAEVRQFAGGEYAAALEKGDAISPAERDAVAAKLAGYIGVSPAFVIRKNLRVDAEGFRKELLRDERRTVGRLDGRFEGEDSDAAGDNTDYDPTDASMSGAFISTLNDYLFRELGYKTDLSYRPNNYAGIGGQWVWTRQRARQLAANTAVDLGEAMRRNPHLKLLSLNGMYDLATPMFGAEYDIKHMSLEPDRQANITFKYYPSGHMVYIDPGSADKLHDDIEAWMDASK